MHHTTPTSTPPLSAKSNLTTLSHSPHSPPHFQSILHRYLSLSTNAHPYAYSAARVSVLRAWHPICTPRMPTVSTPAPAGTILTNRISSAWRSARLPLMHYWLMCHVWHVCPLVWPASMTNTACLASRATSCPLSITHARNHAHTGTSGQLRHRSVSNVWVGATSA